MSSECAKQLSVLALVFSALEESPLTPIPKEKRKRKRQQEVEVGNTPTPKFLKITPEDEEGTATRVDPDMITLREDLASGLIRKPEVCRTFISFFLFFFIYFVYGLSINYMACLKQKN